MSPSIPGLRVVACLSVSLFAAASRAQAQWTWVSMHPQGEVSSEGLGGNALQQVGNIEVAAFGPTHGIVWNPCSGWTDLHPAGANRSSCVGTTGALQGGWFQNQAGEFHAAIWTGTAATLVDLHPSGVVGSWIHGLSGDTQVGSIFPSLQSNKTRACMWKGSASSFVDLGTGLPGSSVALGSAGDQQCGWASFGSNAFAPVVWSGTAASIINLSPSGADGIAFATDGTSQVGKVYLNGGEQHPALWQGTAASFLDLAPPGSIYSAAYALDAGEQVGYVGFPFQLPSAAHWSGSAASWTDLGKLLWPDYDMSEAHAIWHSPAGATYVFGWARNTSLGRREAILWKRVKAATYCTAKVNSLGCTPAISVTGTPSATSTSTCTLRAANLLNDTIGLMVYGACGPASSPFMGGTLCVAAPLQFSPGLGSQGSPPPSVDCSGVLQLDLHAFRDGQLGGVPAPFLAQPGTVVHCQFWSRDLGFPSATAIQLSNALEFEVGP